MGELVPMDLTDESTMDHQERTALERERSRLAKILHERGVITTPGPDEELAVQVVLDRQPEDA